LLGKRPTSMPLHDGAARPDPDGPRTAAFQRSSSEGRPMLVVRWGSGAGDPPGGSRRAPLYAAHNSAGPADQVLVAGSALAIARKQRRGRVSRRCRGPGASRVSRLARGRARVLAVNTPLAESRGGGSVPRGPVVRTRRRGKAGMSARSAMESDARRRGASGRWRGAGWGLRLGEPCSLAMTRPRRPVPGVHALRAIASGTEHNSFDQAVLLHSDRPGGTAGTSRLIGVPRRGSATLGGRSAENVSPELSRR
jgi:hypothetical protein